MLEALRRWLWPPLPFKITYRFARRTVDLLGTEWLLEDATFDARLTALAEGWKVTGEWTREATLLDLYKVGQARPDDVLQLTVKLSPPAGGKS